MSYKIGQIRRNASTSYLTDQAWTAASVKTLGYAERQFNDFAIQIGNDGTFNSNYTYYLRFSIKRIASDDPRFTDYAMTKDANDPRELNIKLQLFKHDGSESNGEYERGSYQVIESGIAVEPHIQGENSEYFSHEVIFTPNSSYPYLGFVLSRTTYDYLGGVPRDDIRSSINLDDRGDLAVINNVLPVVNADKIGVQTRPGALICVNREPIRVGRTGTYELNNGTTISYVGFAGPNGSTTSNIDQFLLDYAYNDD